MKTRSQDNAAAANAKARVMLLSALFLMARTASAALGGDAASLQADQAALNATQHITAAADYQVYELQTASGTVVREYLSTTGVVFAIAWQGPALPNQRLLLGDYFTRYTDAARNWSGGHGHLLIREDDLVVESSGHMRAFFGRAYLPQQIPPGAAVSDIQ